MSARARGVSTSGGGGCCSHFRLKSENVPGLVATGAGGGQSMMVALVTDTNLG